jgi:hypothetical protein
MESATKDFLAKSRMLVISDNQLMIKAVETKLFNAGWFTETLTTHAMMGHGSIITRNHDCIILVIDANFRKSFGSILFEMGAIIKNCAAIAPIYLLFEDNYEHCYSSWLPCVKQFFELDSNQNILIETVQHIVKLEKKGVPRSVFFSPMDSF